MGRIAAFQHRLGMAKVHPLQTYVCCRTLAHRPEQTGLRMPVKDASSVTFFTSCRSRDVRQAPLKAMCVYEFERRLRPENRLASGGSPRSDSAPVMGIAVRLLARPAPIDARFTDAADPGNHRIDRPDAFILDVRSTQGEETTGAEEQHEQRKPQAEAPADWHGPAVLRALQHRRGRRGAHRPRAAHRLAGSGRLALSANCRFYGVRSVFS